MTLYTVFQYDSEKTNWTPLLETYDIKEAVVLQRRKEKEGFTILLDYEDE